MYGFVLSGSFEGVYVAVLCAYVGGVNVEPVVVCGVGGQGRSLGV